MTRIKFREPAGTVDIPGKGEFPQVFARDAFTGVIGKRVPVRGPAGQVIGYGTVVSVTVDADGSGATWTVDVENSSPVADPVLSADLAMSFAVREPETFPRDPFGAGELRVRWLHDPAVSREEGPAAAGDPG